MSRSDAPLKHFIARHPRDWAEFRGVPHDAPVEVVDSDLATTSFAADKVLKVKASEPFILHLEPLLMGIKYKSEIVESLLKGVHHIMQESSTYQAIIEEGRKLGEELGEKRGILAGRKEGLLSGKKETLLLQGRKQLGRRSEEDLAKIEKIASIKRLDNLLLRVLEAHTWDELLSR